LKELRTQIDKKAQEKTIEKIYSDTMNLLSSILGKKSQIQLIADFEKNLVKKGKMTQQHLRTLRNIISARAEFKRGKLDAHKVDYARKEAATLINDLIEFSQRCDLVPLEKGRMRLKFKEGSGELFVYGGKTFLLKNNEVFNITNKLENSNMEEVSHAIEAQKNNKEIEFNPRVLEVLKKEFGEFEVIL